MKLADFTIIRLKQTTSTNDEALKLSQGKSGQKIVVQTCIQTAGRGRLGRSWQSMDGNLFFSVLLEYELKNLGSLIMAAGLSLLNTIIQYSSTAKVQLKWPNDVLLNNAKVSGMLLEKGEGKYIVIGIGVNIVQSPKTPDMLYPAISLQELGIHTTADDFLQKFLPLLAANIKRKATDLQQEWLQHAKGIGEMITVYQNNTQQQGIFSGIDENADLLLQTSKGEQKILAGDVFYDGDKNG